MKDFVDENCSIFSGEEENSFQQGALHNEFKLLIENLLEKMLKEVGGSQEAFLLAAKKGLDSEADKKYFEQIIACDNYLYFKNMMARRNLQLEEEAMKMMRDNLGVGQSQSMNQFTSDLNKLREEKEIECAIRMSLALEEEKRKLGEFEDEDLRVIMY